jgi:soluble lytic murein transglycosylase
MAVLLVVFWLCPAGAVDLNFIDAYQKKDVRALLRYASSDGDDPLEPYLIARISNTQEISEGKLNQDLARALDRFAGVPPIEEIRATVLKAWARKGDWDRFATHIDRLPEWLADQDTEIRCAKITFLRSRKQSVDGLRPALFTRITEFPSLCAPAFAGALATGEVTPDQMKAKFMHIGSLGRKSDAERLLELFTHDLDGKALGRNLGAEILEVLETAKNDYRKGVKAFEQHAHLFSAETKRDVLLHIGVIGARKLEPDAHTLISSVDGYRRSLSPAAAEWRTRAALLSGAWSDMLTSIEHMPSPLREEPAWRYWRARSLDHLRRPDEARLIYADLSRQPGYYGILAAERLGQKRPPYLNQTFSADLSALQGLDKRPEAARALALYKAGLWVEAARELNILMRGADSATYYAAALYAKEKGLLDRQISFAQRASDHVDLTLRYPLLYGREISEAARRTGLSPELLWAVIRQESRFVPHAVSSAGAVGLMQVMPATAKHLSASRGLSGKITRDSLIAPDLNISLGSAFLESMHRRYSGNYALAAAAYNAGPGRVDRWQRQLSGVELEQFIELIPFTETRDYTKQVLTNYVMYAYVTGKEPVSLSSLVAAKLQP